MEYDDSFSEIFPETGILNRYITEGRYPGDVPFESINENDVREAVAAAEKIAEFVLAKMSST